MNIPLSDLIKHSEGMKNPGVAISVLIESRWLARLLNLFTVNLVIGWTVGEMQDDGSITLKSVAYTAEPKI